MLCASHCKSLSILKVLRVPLSFSLFNFQGPTHFLESFLSVLTEPLSTVRELLYHIHFRLSTLFSKFLKSFLKSLSLLLKAFFCVFKPFCCLCFPQATLILYHSFLQIATPFFNFFQKILNNFYFILINSIYSVYIYGIYYF